MMKTAWQMIFALIVLALALAACGSTPTAATGGAPTATVVATTTPTAKTNGCPVQVIPVDSLPPAQLVVTQQNGGNPAPVALTTGQSVEIDLAATFNWHLNLTDPNQILSGVAVEGWHNVTKNACIWRYSATQAGTATLSFIGTPICQAAQPCSQIAIEADFAVTVK